MYRPDWPARPVLLPVPCPLQSSALAVLIAICLCAGDQSLGQDAQPAGKSDTLRGTVVNSVTHEPVGRALVFSPVAIENGWDLDWAQPGVITHYAKRGQTVTVGNQTGVPSACELCLRYSLDSCSIH